MITFFSIVLKIFTCILIALIAFVLALMLFVFLGEFSGEVACHVSNEENNEEIRKNLTEIKKIARKIYILGLKALFFGIITLSLDILSLWAISLH